MLGEAMHFGGARRFLIKSIAGRQSAGVRAGGSGNARSGSTMPITGTIRRGRSVRGRGTTEPTGGPTGRGTPSTRKRTGKSSMTGIVGGVRPILQRWTRQSRFHLCHQGLTFWCRVTRRILQRWTR